MTWQKGFCRWWELRTLSWRESPGSPGWTQSNHQDLTITFESRREPRGEPSKLQGVRGGTVTITRPMAAGRQTQESVPWAEESMQLPEPENDKEAECPWRRQNGTEPGQHSDFTLVRSRPALCPHNWKMISSYCLICRVWGNSIEKQSQTSDRQFYQSSAMPEGNGEQVPGTSVIDPRFPRPPASSRWPFHVLCKGKRCTDDIIKLISFFSGGK